MTSNCASCRHWKTHIIYEVTQAYHDQDRAARVAAGWDPAQSDKHWPVGRRSPQPVQLNGNPDTWGQCYRVYEDSAPFSAECSSEGIGGELITSPDFGCVQWEEGDAADHHHVHSR